MHISTEINPDGSKESFIYIWFWESVLISKIQTVKKWKRMKKISIIISWFLLNYQDNYKFIITLKILDTFEFYQDLILIQNLI